MGSGQLAEIKTGRETGNRDWGWQGDRQDDLPAGKETERSIVVWNAGKGMGNEAGSMECTRQGGQTAGGIAS